MPLDYQFWRNEDNELWNAIGDIVVAAIMAGADVGAQLLPKSIRNMVDQDTFNFAAMNYLKLYQLRDIPNINATTRKNIAVLVNKWLRSGESLQTLEGMMAVVMNDPRAKQIAITEITRLFAQGNLLVWRSIGTVTSKVWQTANDEKVCPLCGPLHNQVVGIETDFQMPMEQMAASPQMQALLGEKYSYEKAVARLQNMYKWNGESVEAPPRHVNCRCWIKPVVSVQEYEEQLTGRLGL